MDLTGVNLRRITVASKGDSNVEAQRVLNAHRTIMGAADRGAISPRGALKYARRAMQGEDVSHLEVLTGSRQFVVEYEATPRLSEDVMCALNGQQVRAHSNAQALQQAHDALDRGHPASYQGDEFSSLFPPSGPNALGPAEDDDDNPAGPGHFTPARKALVQRASAGEPLTEADEFELLYGRPAPRGYFDGE